ncbi:hypothetical protein GQX73_g6127 [Xylaria multiplex]|uniref:Uncharacterized protein n=1 Tax=Xylaria multiplex TaxID=323545 RepID=A0A7C8N3K1_9PEZI|nr:hypothetical protein GQX73_g6127 [Xylaria multiplex]
MDNTVIPLSCASSFHAGDKHRLEYARFSNNLQPPPGFGGWPTMFEKRRGRNRRDGAHLMVTARETVKDDANLENSGRSNSGINDAIDHPQFMGYYNFDGRKFKDLTEKEKRFLEFAVHYPDVRNGIMKAPLLFRTGSFTQPTARQPDLVRKVFGTPELFNKIVSHLIPRYEDLASICRTSQFTAGLVQSLWMHLDATTNDFLGWDTETLASVRVREAQEEEEREKNNSLKHEVAPKRFFSPTVIVSPVRPQDQGPPQEIVRNKAGYPMTPGVEKVKETDFETSMCAHYKLLHMVYLNGHVIKHLILHGLPWLSVAAIKCIVPQMTMLEALGIHQCFVMNFGDTQPLLRVVNAINKERREHKQPHVALDFTPFYYRGPAYKADGTGHIGEYGVLPQDISGIHTTQAVTAHLIGIRDLCHKGSQDLFTSGTGFRSFLNRLPIRTIGSIVQSIENLHQYKNNTYDPESITKKMRYQMEVTLWQDIIISCNGRPMLMRYLEDLLVSRREVKLAHCVECNTELPAYFFLREVLARRAQDVLCQGCQLEYILNNHFWRTYISRRAIAERIFGRTYGTQYSLRKVLNRINKPGTPEIEPSFGQPGQPAQEAIICRPGMVDQEFLQQARDLWKLHTVDIPSQLIEKAKQIAHIDKVYGSLPDEGKELVWNRKGDLEQEVLLLEFELGTSQPGHYNGSLQRPCRSWELNIQDFRAELAIESGRFSNHGPMTIWNLESNVASMLGRSGGFHEYWNDGTNYEELVDNGAGSRHSTRPRHNNRNSGSAACRASGNNPATTLMAKDEHDKAPSSEERASSQASPSQIGLVPPHKRTTRQVAAPAAQAPLQKPPPRQACPSSVPQQDSSPHTAAASFENTPSHQKLPENAVQAQQNKSPQKQRAQTKCTLVQSIRHLLPHQRRGPQAAPAPLSTSQKKTSSVESTPAAKDLVTTTGQATQNIPPHKRPAQTVAQQPPQPHLLPHQRPGPKSVETGHNIPVKMQSAPIPTPTTSYPFTVPRVEQHVHIAPQETRESSSREGNVLTVSRVLPNQRRLTRHDSGSRNRILRIERTPRAS